jgi:phosphoglycerate dehydrogenase-like enzyme
MAAHSFDSVYGPDDRAEIATRVVNTGRLLTSEEYHATSEVWPDVEVLFSGWGMVPMDEAFFERMPRLRIVFYAAGTVRGFVTDLVWQRNIRLVNAAAANAVPVSEFTLSQILFSLKHGWRQALSARKMGRFPDLTAMPGGYQSTIGLISLGTIGRMVAERLRQFDVKVVAYDPYFSPEEAAALGVTLLSLDGVFRLADVVSCHAPLLPETERLIGRRHFESMKPGATFINTARGAVVDEAEMISVLQDRDDLFALLDVTDPLPPPDGSPLYSLDNIVVTPHIAGSLGNECRRMGHLMLEELDRYLAGKPLRHEIDFAQFQSMA